MDLQALIALPAVVVAGIQQPEWPPVLENQVAILMELFESTDGENWKEKSGWGTSASPCEWYGIWCDIDFVNGEQHSSVMGIMLMDNGLRGHLPASIASLPDLGILAVASNELTGEVPEEILKKWDEHEFEFHGAKNSFPNMILRARVELRSGGVLCSLDEDTNYVFDVRELGPSRFESVRCTPDTERETHCLVRTGNGPSLQVLTRALRMLGYRSFGAEYSFPFTAVTHQSHVTVTTWWGDGSKKTVEIYGGQGPIEVWIAQELFLSLLDATDWETEYTEPECTNLE